MWFEGLLEETEEDPPHPLSILGAEKTSIKCYPRIEEKNPPVAEDLVMDSRFFDTVLARRCPRRAKPLSFALSVLITFAKRQRCKKWLVTGWIPAISHKIGDRCPIY